MTRFTGWLAAIPLFLPAAPLPAMAAWTSNGTPIVTLAGDQSASRAVPDGFGGAVIVWRDVRGADYDTYVQRVDRLGNALWTPGGVLVCGATGNQTQPHVATDGSGGAIISWDDLRGVDGHIYAQRVDATGAPQWTTDGIPICTAPGYHTGNFILVDGAGGAFIAWNFGSGGSTDVYMQRVDAAGNVLWTTDGVPAAATTSYQYNPQMVGDDLGGVMLAWTDRRSGLWEMYAGHMDGNGNPVGTVNGVMFGDGVSSTLVPVFNVDRDGAGGIVVGWFNGGGGHVRRVDATLTPQWPSAATLFISAQHMPAVAGDGAGGAFVAWDQYAADSDVFVQHFDAGGNAVWWPSGVVASNANNNQISPLITREESGGVVVLWNDQVNGGFPQLYAQRFDGATGLASWAANGVPVSLTPSFRTLTSVVTTDGAGVMAAWDDGDVYIQRFHSLTGDWGTPDASIATVGDVPGDQGGLVQVDWNASDRDHGTVTYYSLWRASDFAAAGEGRLLDAASTDARVASRGDVGPDFHGEARYVQHTAAGTYYWEWVGNTTANQSASYGTLAPTRRDAVPDDQALHAFQVLAHTSNSFVFWESAVMTGASSDDLAPAAPQGLVASRDGNDVDLAWSPSGQNEPDFQEFAVYRDGASPVSVDPAHFVGSTTDLSFRDVGVPLSALYYVVVARDIHDNESTSSNEAMIATPTGAAVPALSALQVRPNAPNPFNAFTRMEVGAPHAGTASVEVFDVTGRRVVAQRVARLAAGWNTLEFNGRDDNGRVLPSGVYFWRVTAAGESRVRKIVLQR